MGKAEGSGEGGAMGTPSLDPDEAPPSADQEANSVSGGGLIGSDDDKGPSEMAKKSPSSQAPDS